MGSGNDVGVAAGSAVEVGEGIGVSTEPTTGVAVLVIRAATTAEDPPGGVPVTVIGTGVFPEAGVASRLAGGSAVGASDVGEGVGIPGEGVAVGSVTQAIVSAAIAPTKMIALMRFFSLCHIIRGCPFANAALMR